MMQTYTQFDLTGAVKRATDKHYYIYLELDEKDRIQFCLNKDDTDEFYCFNDLFGVFDYLEVQPEPVD